MASWGLNQVLCGSYGIHHPHSSGRGELLSSLRKASLPVSRSVEALSSSVTSSARHHLVRSAPYGSYHHQASVLVMLVTTLSPSRNQVIPKIDLTTPWLRQESNSSSYHPIAPKKMPNQPPSNEKLPIHTQLARRTPRQDVSERYSTKPKKLPGSKVKVAHPKTVSSKAL